MEDERPEKELVALTRREWEELRLGWSLPQNAQNFISVAFGMLTPTLAELEEWYIWMVLARKGGRLGETAELLGINPSTLWRKLAKWDKRDGFRKTEEFQSAMSEGDDLMRLFNSTAATFGRGKKGGFPRTPKSDALPDPNQETG